jgi:NADPH:quinone reductase-like Zn-dependent oxidoreductase
VLAACLQPDGIKLERLPKPSPSEGELLIRVHAAAITRNELTWSVDRLPAIPSYEVSGVVAASRGGADSFAEGARCSV